MRKTFSELRLSGLFICVALGLLSYFYADFSHQQFYKIYALDICALLVLFCFAIEYKFLSLSKIHKISLKPLFPLLSFCIWGGILLCTDILSRWSTGLAFGRIAQHAILFVYPLIWVSLGYFLTLYSQSLVRLSTYVVITGISLGFLFRAPEHVEKWNMLNVNNNISAGPLALIPLVFVLEQILCRGKSAHLFAYTCLVFFFGALCFHPFWHMWTTSIQRTSFILLILNILLAPLLITRFSWRRSTLITGILFIIFVLGSSIYLEVKLQGQTISQHINQLIVSAMSRGETPISSTASIDQNLVTQMGSRIFLWKQGISDWKESPIFGVGFIPEVPEYYLPGEKNNGMHVHFEMKKDVVPANPIAGPHNSYISVLARTGVIGFLLFFLLWFFWLRAVWPLIFSKLDRISLLGLILIPLNGAIHAFVNIGFESPHNSALLWAFLGMGLATALRKERYE